MNTLRSFSKQLFGAKYERIVRSFIACLILFLGISVAEIGTKIAPYILFLSATVLSAGVMWRALTSSGNTDSMSGLFMLPFANRNMIFSLVWAYTAYTVITKTLPVLVLFFAVCEWSISQIAVSFLCAWNGCFMAAAWCTMMKKRRSLFFIVLWGVGIILSIFAVRKLAAFALIVLISLTLSFLRLMMADAYEFYRMQSARPLVRHIRGRGGVLVYLFRYLITNKNYLLNTVGLCVLAGVLPLLFGQFQGESVMPLGFAILCLNTPIGILLSCDRDLEQAVRVLPGQAKCFCSCYCLFIFLVNMAVSGVYLISWQVQHGGVGGTEMIAAVLITLQSSVLSVLMEWFYPVRNWNIENDLLHHPRKYIVPAMMMLVAGVIGMWPGSVWILSVVVLAECLGLAYAARRMS